MTVSPAEARDFVSRWHYSRSAVAGVARYGWEVDGELVGVSIYDNGNHAMRQGVFGHEHFRHVLHHHRLAMTEGAPKLSESEFIGACLRQLRKDRPETWAVVSYADFCEGHVGTIYKATNATYTGVVGRGELKFRTSDGRLVSTQSMKGVWPARRAAAAELGWTEVRCLGKFRFVYLLGTKTQRRRRPAMRWPQLPYGADPRYPKYHSLLPFEAS